MANAGRIGNCRRRSVNGRPASVGDSGMRGISRILLEYSPHATSPVMYLGLTPLQWPRDGSMFLSNDDSGAKFNVKFMRRQSTQCQ